MAKMLGDLRDQGCAHGKRCTCNARYRSKVYTRVTKRRERQAWKRGAGSEALA